MDKDLIIVEPKWDSCDRVVIVGKHFDGVIEVQYPKECDGLGFIWNFWVDPSYRGCGFGRKLFNAAIAHILARGCRIAELDWSRKESDYWTFEWYKKQGFRVVENFGKGKGKRLRKDLWQDSI